MKQTLLILVIVLFAQISFSQEIGSIAPDFTLQNTDDETFKLSDHKGKVVVVFLFGYNCASCKAIAPDVQSKIADVYASEEDFLIIGIDTWDGSKAQVQSFKNTTNLGFDVMQKGSQVANSWETSYDRIVVVDKAGNLAFKGDGLASTHINQAIEAVNTALSTKTSIFSFDSKNNLDVKVFPNPVVDRVSIHFTLTQNEKISASVFNLSGKLIYRLPEEDYNSGENILSFPANNFQKGIHFVNLKINQTILTERFMVN